MNESTQQVHPLLTTIPGFENLAADAYTAERLGGLTNLVFRIDTGADRYVLRIPGKGTEEYIDRAVEIHNARIAARADVSAEVLYADSASGIMLSRHIDGIVTMTPDQFSKREGAPTRAALAFKKMHDWPEAFKFRFELFAMIDDYLKILDERKAELPAGYADVVDAAQPVRSALDRNPSDLAPCHCDPLCENLLDSGDRMWIVDWEYSGMNDPMWDLGDLSVEAGFTPAQDMELMRAYCGDDPTAAEFGRMVIYKAMCDLLWTLWGLIQHSDGNPAEDFWAYASERFERCKALMSEPEFTRHVKAISDQA
ncbi:MAG: phosphotransferase family protein [Gammaproteobacteria bacterium]|nr:phosphotransferase family protein [Gammaproteobacteria bacterium]